MLDNNNLMTPNLLISDESLTSAKLDNVLRTLKLSLKTSAKSLDIAFTDLNQSLGFLPADIYRKIDALLNTLENKEAPNAIDLISLGELIGEFNAFARYSNKLRYQKSMEAKINKVAKLNALKTTLYLQTARELHGSVVGQTKFSGFDDWAILSAIDLFLRATLDQSQIISEHKATSKLANYLGLKNEKGRKSNIQIEQRQLVLSFLKKDSTDFCLLLYGDLSQYEMSEVYGYPVPQEDKRLTLLLAVAEELSNSRIFHSLKSKLTHKILSDLMLSALAKKFLMNQLDPEAELVFSSKLRSYFHEFGIRDSIENKNHRVIKSLSSLQKNELAEVVFNLFRNTA